MKASLITLTLFSSFLLFSSCSTGPDFERDNPYDRNQEADPLEVRQFPPSYPHKYIFTGSGLKLNVYKNSASLGEITILRKNGYSKYHLLDTMVVYSNGSEDFAEYYLDAEIIKAEDIGYPLIYNIMTNSTGKTSYVEIDFGNIQNVTITTTEDHLIVSWQDSVFLNNGFQIFREKDGKISEFADLSVPNTSFSIPITEENLSSEYLIFPYKYFHGEKTYLDTTYFYPTSPPPTNLNLEIVDTGKLKLSWNDISSVETGYKIIDDNSNEVFDLPADQESIVFEETLTPFDFKSFTIFAMLNDKPSTPTSIDTTIPDFPYPEITDLKHINENTFEVHFKDRVSFERQLYFSLNGNTKFVVNSSKGFVEITVLNEHEFLELDFSADISHGKYGNRFIPISKRASLKILAEFDLSIGSTPKTVDIRTIGNLLAYSSENHIYKVDLTTLKSQSSSMATLPANINLLRLSNDNSKAFVSTKENTFYLVNMLDGSNENLDNIPNTVYDASFIEDDTKVVMSTNKGLRIYSLVTNQSSELDNFDITTELEFTGDASRTPLLALDRNNYNLHYFNTTSGFEFFNTATLDKSAIDGHSSKLTNISHLNSRNNVMGYEIGGGVEFRIDDPNCSHGEFICFYGYHNRYYGFDSNSIWDRNAYFQIIDPEFRLASTENFLRIVDKLNFFNIHVIKREPTEVSMLKVNYEANIAVELHENIKKLVFYDLSKKWGFTNYDNYFDLVWPSN